MLNSSVKARPSGDRIWVPVRCFKRCREALQQDDFWIQCRGLNTENRVLGGVTIAELQRDHEGMWFVTIPTLYYSCGARTACLPVDKLKHSSGLRPSCQQGHQALGNRREVLTCVDYMLQRVRACACVCLCVTHGSPPPSQMKQKHLKSDVRATGGPSM